MTLPINTLNAWSRQISGMAEGLDFKDAEDRSAFRLRLHDQFSLARVSLIVDIAQLLGETPDDRSRDAAVRAVAAGWMAGRRLNEKGDDAAFVASWLKERGLVAARYRTRDEHNAAFPEPIENLVEVEIDP